MLRSYRRAAGSTQSHARGHRTFAASRTVLVMAVLVAQSRPWCSMLARGERGSMLKVQQRERRSWLRRGASGHAFKKSVFRGVYLAELACYRHEAPPNGDIR